MHDTIEIAVLIGSLRADSFSGRLAKALGERAPEHVSMRDVPIGDLPLYNQDKDGEQAPSAYAPFRDAIGSADGVLFVTPEYNRSTPGCLKNAIDVASRPYGKGVIIGKPAAILSHSPGPLGGFGANHAIRQSLVFLNSPILQQPEAYIGNVANAFDNDGSLIDEGLGTLLTTFTRAFADLIARSRLGLD